MEAKDLLVLSLPVPVLHHINSAHTLPLNLKSITILLSNLCLDTPWETCVGGFVS